MSKPHPALIPPPESPEQFMEQFSAWAKLQAEISEVILVGSYATGKSTPDSDIDLVILCKDPNNYLKDQTWTQQFGGVKNSTIENWGRVTSLRVRYATSLEIEFGFARQDWLQKPIDEGTRTVLLNGYKPLFDRAGRLASLAEELRE